MADDSFTTKDIRAAVEVAKAHDATQHGAGCMKDVGGDCGPGCVVMVPIDGPPVFKPAKVIEVASTPLDALGFEGVSSINIGLGFDRKAFVFTMSQAARDAYPTDKLGELATMLGALVHPSSAVLVVLPDGEQLSAYRVEVE